MADITSSTAGSTAMLLPLSLCAKDGEVLSTAVVAEDVVMAAALVLTASGEVSTCSTVPWSTALLPAKMVSANSSNHNSLNKVDVADFAATGWGHKEDTAILLFLSRANILSNTCNCHRVPTASTLPFHPQPMSVTGVLGEAGAVDAADRDLVVVGEAGAVVGMFRPTI
jgi:hypothetical protein